MTGAFNRYRAAALDAAADADIIGATVAQPSCFIGGELDPVRSMLPGTDLFAEPGAGVHRLPRRHDRRRRRSLGPPGGRRRDQRRAGRVPGLARMTDHRGRYGPHNPDDTYVGHELAEHLADLGEVQMNYATAGDEGAPALLLIPGQTQSWWSYEAAMRRLAERFEVFAVDLRGQGRSTRTPGRYTLDNMGNDLVRFIDLVIGRPTIVSGLSSGGVLSAWMSAYAEPGQVVAACYEDPPLFSSEVHPAIGPGIRQCIGPVFDLWSTYLGDQWSIGAWDAMREGAADVLPPRLQMITFEDEPPQYLKEYDPEWGRAFWTGTVAASCDHERMLRSVKVPVLLTHHFRIVDDAGNLLGAMTDAQAEGVRNLLATGNVRVDYRSFPEVGHSMHSEEPDLFVDTLLDWVDGLDT